MTTDQSPDPQGSRVSDDDVLTFAANAIGSVWTLELLLLLHSNPDRTWQDAELIAPLRANSRIVGESLATLSANGLAAADDAGRFRYAPASVTLAGAVDALVSLHRLKPMAVTNAILSGRNDKIRIFADAFRFRN